MLRIERLLWNDGDGLHGHGECGRMLTAYAMKTGEAPVYQCGCFSGSLDELKDYIAKGSEAWKPSRTRAMEIVTELLNIQRYGYCHT